MAVVCAIADLAEGEIRQVELSDGRVLAVCRIDGEIFATDDLCTHGEASLSEGELEGHELLCPFHLGAFDVRTGEATRSPCFEALRTYAVTIEDGLVMVSD